MKKLLIFIFIFVVPYSALAIVIEKKEPIKILLVPGHDNEVWGAQYGNVKEADMNLVLGTKIYNLLKKDKRFKVWITRDSLGYMPEFSDYFTLKKDDILFFRESAKKKTEEEINNGSFVKKKDVQHNTATPDMAIRLYGINKWANENKMDAIIHIHFNDYPRPNKWTKGVYKGFNIYVPEEQMTNSAESIKLAKKVFLQISKKYIPSTYEEELGGITPDQSLIALGTRGTLLESVKSILIEYGYIYRFGNRTVRHQMYANMANLTVTGIKNYFLKK